MDHWAYFRFTTLSVLLGFAFFCFSYATWVWRKRQPATDGGQSRLSRLWTGWSRAALFTGLALGVVAFIVCEVVPMKGVMRLDRSFAVRTRADIDLGYLAPEGPVNKGDVLARFSPSNFKAEEAILQAKRDKLVAERDKTASQPLEIDEELTRTHQNALAKIDQAHSALNNLIPLHKETVRIGLEKRLDRIDKWIAIDRYITDYDATRKQSVSELDVRLKEFQRVSKLARDHGIITDREYELKRHEAVSSAEQVQKLERSIELFKREADQLKANAEKFDQLITTQATALNAEINRFEQSLRAAERERDSLEEAIASDNRRAQKQRDAELAMITAELGEVDAGIQSLHTVNTVLAPHDGEVVYRSAAANSVEEHGVVLVMAENGMADVAFTMPATQVKPLSKEGTVDVWVSDSVLAAQLRGKVTSTQISPVNPDHRIVHVACLPPMDLLPMLANEQLVPVELTWAPPLLTVPLFQLASIMTLAGAFGLLLGSMALPKPSKEAEAEAEEPMSIQPSIPAPAVETQPADNKRPRPVFGLHAGSTGAAIQLLGNQFREALFEGDVDADLISSLEWTIDRHHTRGVKMLRQGFVGTLTEHENLETKLDESLARLNQTGTLSADTLERLRGVLNVLDVVEFHRQADKFSDIPR